MTAKGGTAVRPSTGAHRIRSLTWWALLMELRGYLNIYRFVFRRPRVPAGATGFSYHQQVLAVMIVIVVVSTVELVVVDVIVHRWPSIRIPFLILGLWGLVYGLGLLFGMLTRPHAVTRPDGIRVRSGTGMDMALPWESVYSVTRRKHTVQDKQPKITIDDNGDATLHLRIQNETNLELQLEEATEVHLAQGTETVSKINVHADDPEGFMTEVRRHIG